MKTNYKKQEKQSRSLLLGGKKRSYWNQCFKRKPKSNIIEGDVKIKKVKKVKKFNKFNKFKKFKKVSKVRKIRKSLQYIFLLKAFKNIIDYKNIKLLRAFLTISGKIHPRRKTRISIKHQRTLSKSIRKARAFGILPYTIDVKGKV